MENRLGRRFFRRTALGKSVLRALYRIIYPLWPLERVQRLGIECDWCKRRPIERVGSFSLDKSSVEAVSTHCMNPANIPKENYLNFRRDEGFEIEVV